MNVGDLYWIEFPVRGGHAQTGRRPAIVAQGMLTSIKLPTILVIPLTSQLDALRFPGTVLIEQNAENGLSRSSIALVFQMTVVDKRHVSSYLGKVSHIVLQEIWLALDSITERVIP